ncbi:MAG: hypothetical protein WAN48_10760 [Actinomycetes bacterium]
MTLGVLRERPTATRRPGDVSLVDARASAAADGRRASVCACGGLIVAEPTGDGIFAAVYLHNASLTHGIWRRRMVV